MSGGIPKGKGTSDKKSEYGPGWYDVCQEIRQSGMLPQERFDVRIECRGTRDGHWGLAVQVFDRRTGKLLAGAGYGPAFPNGAKTMAAAIVHALIKAERERRIETLQEAALQEMLPLEPSEG